MKITYYISKLFLLFIVVGMTACTEHELFKTDEEGAYRTTITLNVAQSSTRNARLEDKIKRVDIMLFREDVLEKVMKNITSFENASGHNSITISFETEGIRKAYIVANNDNEIWLNALEIGKTTIDAMKAIHTAPLQQMPNTPFVMSGISHDINFSINSSSVTCDLSRVVAKIEVNNKASNFTLTSARLLNSKESSCIFPDGKNENTRAKDFTPMQAADKSVTLYTYESGTENSKKTTAIEIEGEVNGALLTDTVHFAVDNTPFAIKRNYYYTIHINDIKKHRLTVLMDVKPWKVGNDINQTVLGNKPLVDVLTESAVATYSKIDSTLTVTSLGGQVLVEAKANAECKLEFSGEWIKLSPTTRTASFIDGCFNVSIDANQGSQERRAIIKVINQISNLSQTIIVKQSPGKVVADKYMVLVVAGQSNAVGYDQSPVDAEDLITPERALQLSYREGISPKQNLSIIPLKWCADDIDAYKREGYNDSGHRGLKGIHLPLVKELLKYVPAEYNIVVVPVAYASSRFAQSNGFGTYNTTLKRPNEMTGFLRWGAQSAYRNTIVDRVKHLLDTDDQSKFLGVVWCQGENDSSNSDYHYTEFTKMAEEILNDLNRAGYGNRSTYGTIDKRSWYTYSSCSYWVDWYSPEDASAIFGGYKAWNPDTYIHIPSDLPSNPEGGFGMGKYHFGKNAYRKIATMVAERMNQNGLLFNNASKITGHFTDKTTLTQASVQGGSVNDSDVSSSLILMAPFKQSITEKTGTPSILATNMSLVPAQGLKSITGTARQRNALELSPDKGYLKIRGIPTVTDWSMSFMFKRTGRFSMDMQSIVTPQIVNTSFIGFRKYSSVMGVAKAAEFVVEPIYANFKAKAIPGQFMAADKVRALDEWIHYTITYHNATKETCIYMNGELVQKKSIANTSNVNLSTIYVGNINSTFPTAEGQLMDLCIWGKVLTPVTVRKVFLMGYYGYTK